MEFPLPDELTWLIFNQLDAPTLLKCMQVCKLFHCIISNSTQLVYKIELFASCTVDNEHSSMDILGRLDALREQNRVWDDMKWASYGTIPMRDGHCWEFSGGILAQSTAQNEIFLVQLPCKLKGIAERRWSIPFDFRIRDFTFDKSQDLIVLLESVGDYPNVSNTLHLRTFSGEKHPRSTVAHIICGPQNDILSFSFAIQICGNHLALLQLGFQYSLVIWNWQNGHQKMHIRMPEFHSFAFISEDLILAAIRRSDREPTLQVLNIAACANPIHSLEDMPYVCELRYPEVQGIADSFLIRSDPSPSSKLPADPGVPFYCSRKDLIFTISMRIYSDEIRENIVHFVPLSTILSEVERSRDISRRSVPWDTWGPRGTRMVCRKPSEVWVCYTYGMKFIQGLQRKKGHLARVYDFNPYAARRHDKPSIGPPVPWKPLAKQSKPSPQCKSFDEEVITTLPGRVTNVTLHHSEDGWEAAMIGENHILMVQSKTLTYGYMAM